MNILSLSGLIPEQICDTVRFLGHAGNVRISHYCQYAADFISQVLEDPEIDGAVFPRSCDSSRGIGSYLAGSGKFIHRMHIPARRDQAARTYLAESIRRYQAAVEEHYGVRLDDIHQRAELVNGRNRAISGLYDELEALSYSAYIDMIHALLRMPLAEQDVPEALPACAPGKPVYIVGSTMCNASIASALESAGMNIVGDRLTESRRLFSAPPVDLKGDIYENIAASMLMNQVSPTQNDFGSILKEDMAEIKDKGVRGVIFITQKYCEPYDFLYSVYKKMLDELSVPALRLALTDSLDSRRPDAAIEAFADII